MRLQKYLADAGIASRRKCEEIISAGRVKVNGHVAVLGSSVEPEDSVTLDDKPVHPADERDRKSTRLNSSHRHTSRMPSSA